MRMLIAGNWKMNGTLADITRFAATLRQHVGVPRCDLLVCPPAQLLYPAVALLAETPVALGGQNCHAQAQGAYTGDISAAMLRDVGACYTIVGHSERRADHGETDAQVRAKALAATGAGLSVIVCVGESAAERQAGHECAVVGAQLDGSVPDGFEGAIAYEPIWAIGTGRTPSTAEIAAMHGFIRAELRRRLGAGGSRVRILYGGSVKPDNAAELLRVPEVGGALVGGASLLAADFLAIARAVPGSGAPGA